VVAVGCCPYSEARAAGWGGVAAVAEITGLARSRIIRGLKDLDGPALEPGRIRCAGGRRHIPANEAGALQAKVLTKDEARRIAINVARLPGRDDSGGREGYGRPRSAANPCHSINIGGPAPSRPQEPGYLWAYRGL